MAKRGSDKAFLYVDGYNLGSDLTDFALKKSAATEETTTLGDTWEEHESVNLKNGELTAQGFYNDALSDVVLNEQQGTQPVVCAGLDGDTAGEEFTGLAGMQADYNRTQQRGQFHKITTMIRGNGQIDEGVILKALAAVTAAGQSSSHDNSASSSDGAVGYLQVTAIDLDGYDDWTVKIEHSADNSTFADLITFAAVTAVGAERKTASGTVNRYTRTDHALGGSGTSPSLTYFCGISRG